ncbi:hypothetical protein [Methylobacterium sp. GC_Met_3]|uniref:hypothetical protein n=1 Tax=Methylobacterium sp. GC_Met_3 TaxID=2937375 RepID=UPI00226A3813|nr:hypothetical protein [Methylobacterium sp. GC_Met_3]
MALILCLPATAWAGPIALQAVEQASSDKLTDDFCFDEFLHCADVPKAVITNVDGGKKISAPPGYWFTLSRDGHPVTAKGVADMPFYCLGGEMFTVKDMNDGATVITFKAMKKWFGLGSAMKCKLYAGYPNFTP